MLNMLACSTAVKNLHLACCNILCHHISVSQLHHHRVKPLRCTIKSKSCSYLVKLYEKIHEKILQSFVMSLIYHSAAEETINLDITYEYEN